MLSTLNFLVNLCFSGHFMYFAGCGGVSILGKLRFEYIAYSTDLNKSVRYYALIVQWACCI